VTRRYHRVMGTRLRTAWCSAVGLVGVLLLVPAVVSAQGGPDAQLATARGAKRIPLLAAATAAAAANQPKQAVALGTEALELLVVHPDTAVEAAVANDMASAYNMLGESEKALDLAERAARLARARTDRVLESRAERNAGNACLRLNRYDKALERISRALALAGSAGARLDQALATKLEGIVYDELGDYRRALASYLEAQRTFEDLKAWKDVATTLNNVGIVYSKTKDYERALECYARALEVEQSLGEKRATSNTLNNIGVVHFERGAYAAALDYYRRALDIERDLGSDWGVGIALANIAEVEEKLNRHEAALGHYRQALELARKSEDQWGVATVLRALGTIHSAQGHFALATAEIEQGLGIAREIKAREVERDCLLDLAGLHERRGDWRQALALYKEHGVVQEEILSAESRRTITESRSRLEIASREHEIELLRRDAALKELDLRRGRIQSLALLAVAALLGTLAVVSVVAYRHASRAAALIKAQSEALAEAARTDPLTGLSNRRHFAEMAVLEEVRVSRSGRPFAVVLADIDDFKAINDRHGHDSGDTVLRHVAGLMRATLRKLDVIGRWGGEEFIWLLPETDLGGGVAVAERVRLALVGQGVPVAEGQIAVSATFGVAEYVGGEEVQHCVTRADAALYDGKRAGKNRVVAAPHPPPPDQADTGQTPA
jgi:diguanylate cyclase (GGDEF)-like protein